LLLRVGLCSCIIPLILIYRKYYGAKAALYITAILFISMVSAGIIVDLLFGAFGLIPNVRPPSCIAEASFQCNYTTWLDFVAILLSGWFVWIYFKKICLNKWPDDVSKSHDQLRN
jgi:hypothetical protein